MPMPRRGPNKLAELTEQLDGLRKDVTKHSKDIVSLKARIVDAESRLAKAETALGTIAKSGAPPDAVPEETAREQQPETE